MRRLGELRWRASGDEVEVELQDQVNRSGRPRDPSLPDVHTLVCLEFLRAAASHLEALEVGRTPEGLTRGRERDSLRPSRTRPGASSSGRRTTAACWRSSNSGPTR